MGFDMGTSKLKQSTPTLGADELTLSLVASGVVHVSQQAASGASLTYPYPSALQRGLDRLVVAMLKRGKAPPASVPDLLQWCQRPLAEWGLQLEEGAIGDGDRLVDDQLPTGVCENWAVTNQDVEAELTEQAFMKTLFDLCRARKDPTGYSVIRRLLIEQPVMNSFEFQRLQADPHFAGFEQHLVEAYQLASTALVIDDHYPCCKHCGNLMRRTDRDRLVCENERCQLLGNVVGRKIPAREHAYWIRRGLRRYVAAPGQTEVRLAESVQARGLDVELWPQYDAYDLRITFPDGEIWAVDVKDWANPFLLARQVHPIPKHPPWTKAFFVFPDERGLQRSDYLRAFQNHCSVAPRVTKAMYVTQFLRRVDQKAKRVR